MLTQVQMRSLYCSTKYSLLNVPSSYFFELTNLENNNLAAQAAILILTPHFSPKKAIANSESLPHLGLAGAFTPSRKRQCVVKVRQDIRIN